MITLVIAVVAFVGGFGCGIAIMVIGFAYWVASEDETPRFPT